MIEGPLTLTAVGFLLGFRHAFEPDHLAAVSTLATRQGNVRDAARLGLAWGSGHTASVALVALVLIAAGWRLPDRLQPAADLLVAILLVMLGIAVLLRLTRAHRRSLDEAHHQAHRHHQHHGHLPPTRDARQSLAFGLAHGLAGSGGIVVLMVAAAATRGAQLAYLASFGAGTIGGMLVVSAAVALAARAAGVATSRLTSWLQAGAATASIGVGLWLGTTCLAALA